MATVITPAGETIEGVHGVLLDYYRGEGYEVREDAVPEPVAVAPQDPPPDVPAKSANKTELATYVVGIGGSELTVEELVAAHDRDELLTLAGLESD